MLAFMTTRQERVPAVEGWFSLDDPPALTGSRCVRCGTYAFPPESLACRNPACDSGDFEQVPLSRRGRIWSYTDARYPPPPPFPASEPYEPFAIAAVELAKEKMVVMGQVASGFSVADLWVGQEVELVVETLHREGTTDYVVWKWLPLSAGAPGSVTSGARQ
jgi:uncharacterized OB-fold protein